MRVIEEAIVRRVAKALLLSGRPITVYDGGAPDEYPVQDSADIDAIVEAVFAVDEAWLYVDAAPGGGYRSFIYFIFGNGNNGLDVITDYSVSLEGVLDPINTWIEGFPEGWVCTAEEQ